jgi:hypothetical protein
MQRPRLSPNLHFGLALGIATASVVLALSGCASMGSGPGGSVRTTGAETASPSPSLDDFSEDEQVRILAVQELVAKAAAEHTLDPALLNAMIWVESRFDPKAKSPSGARGLMQLMPATAAYLAKRMGENNARAYDPEFNVRAGALYLAEMREKFGDEQLAVAAYHAGPGNVKKWVESGQKFPEYSEAYVAKVMTARGRFTGAAVHGRRSSDRPVAAAPIPSAKLEPSASESEDIEADAALIVPDVASLPDAAEIHGVQRVIYEAPAPEPEIDESPVFEAHPELDRNPSAPPPGWRTKPAPSKPRANPAAKPERAQPAKPAPKPEPKPEPESEPDEIGLGVLPDL